MEFTLSRPKYHRFVRHKVISHIPRSLPRQHTHLQQTQSLIIQGSFRLPLFFPPKEPWDGKILPIPFPGGVRHVFGHVCPWLHVLRDSFRPAPVPLGVRERRHCHADDDANEAKQCAFGPAHPVARGTIGVVVGCNSWQALHEVRNWEEPGEEPIEGVLRLIQSDFEACTPSCDALLIPSIHFNGAWFPLHQLLTLAWCTGP